MDLSLREINYILAIKSEGNITKAAQVLHIAQPSLTQSLKKIETRLQTTLFFRTANQMKPTYAGEKFIDAGLKIMQISRDLENDLQDIANLDAGRIILGITLLLGSYMFPLIKKVYSKIHPRVEIRLVERTSTQLEQLVHSGEIDAAILPTAGKEKNGLKYIRLKTARVLLVMPRGHWLEEHFYTKPGNIFPYVDINLTAKEPYLTSFEGQRMNQVTETIFKRSGINPPVIFKSRSIETIKCMAAAGIGLAFIPDYYKGLIQTTDDATFCCIEERYVPEWSISVICQDKTHLSATVTEFIRILKNDIPLPL